MSAVIAGALEFALRFLPGHRSIRWRLTAIGLAVTLAGLGVMAAGLVMINRAMFERTLVHDVSIVADVIGDNSRAALLFQDTKSAAAILGAVQADRHIVVAALYDARGALFAEYRRPGADDVLPRTLPALRETRRFAGGFLDLIRPIRLDERAVGGIYIRSDTTKWSETLRSFLWVLGGLLLLTLAVTLALSVPLQGLITKPIAHLAETARRVFRERDYALRAVKHTDDEIGVLVDGFNEMLTEICRRDAELRSAHEELERRVVERTAQLQAVNAELESFSYSVAHDLRAPLRAIDGFSQALLEDYAGGLDNQGRDHLRRVRDGSQRMAHLIDDMLKLSRVTRAELRREEVDLSALARDIASELGRGHPDQEVEFSAASGLRAHGDPRLLRIAIENLLDNAWKFTRGRNPARIELGMRPEPDGKPAYFVRDNGVGFDMAYSGKLFGAFQRLHDAREFHGTGIGLATVQRVVHKHGGKVWAEGEVGKGATFFFTL